MQELQEKGRELPERLLRIDFDDNESNANVIAEEHSNFDEDMFAAEDYEYEGNEFQDESILYEDDPSFLQGGPSGCTLCFADILSTAAFQCEEATFCDGTLV